MALEAAPSTSQTQAKPVLIESLPNLAPENDDFGVLEGHAASATQIEKAWKVQEKNPQDVLPNIAPRPIPRSLPTPEI